MSAMVERDYFTDHEILKDPYAYFDALRAKGPVYHDPRSGVYFVTGFNEVLEVLKNQQDFSSMISVQGPNAPLPFEPQGNDISAQIEENRAKLMGGDLVVAYDDRQHTQSRALLNRLFTPGKLKASQQYIADFSDQMIDEIVAKGQCELIEDIATPFVTMIIADLLGVPMEDRKIFMDAIANGPPPGSLDPEDLMRGNHPLVVMGTYFAQYVFARRTTPCNDILSEIANASYPDGSTPDLLEIVRLTTFLFGAGQDTSAKLLGNAMCYITDEPGLQQQLRNDPSLIPAMMEEVLRLEGSTKMTARLARRDTKIGDLNVPAGSRIFVGLAAANRDPARWENPEIFQLNRPRIAEHLAFGRGSHVCIGAPLARVEVRILLETLLAKTSHIDLCSNHHGPRGNRTLNFESSFIIRGLAELHLVLTPAH